MSNKNKKKSEQKKDESSGSLLRDARSASELSVEHIAVQLRLSSEIIEALETDDVDNLPAPIFVRGYIRSYSTLVGVPSEQVLDCYNKMIGEDPVASLSTVRMGHTAVEGDSKLRKLLPFAIAGMLILLVAIIWLSSEPDQANEQVVEVDDVITKKAPVESVAEPSDSSLALPAVVEQPEVADKPVSQPQTAAIADKPAEAPATDAPAAIEQPASDTPSSSNAVNPAEANPDEEHLVFEFAADSWADVSDANGIRLIFRMARAGQRRSVSGKPPFKITLGNAKAVSLTRNGKVIDLAPYIRGNVAKFSLGKLKQ